MLRAYLSLSGDSDQAQSGSELFDFAVREHLPLPEDARLSVHLLGKYIEHHQVPCWVAYSAMILCIEKFRWIPASEEEEEAFYECFCAYQSSRNGRRLSFFEILMVLPEYLGSSFSQFCYCHKREIFKFLG